MSAFRELLYEGYHDGGDGSCVDINACATQFELNEEGVCILVGCPVGGMNPPACWCPAEVSGAILDLNFAEMENGTTSGAVLDTSGNNNHATLRWWRCIHGARLDYRRALLWWLQL